VSSANLRIVTDPDAFAAPERPDDALVVAWQEGCEASFAKLVDQHGAALYRLLLAILSNPAAAEDAWSETWIRVIRWSDRYEPGGSFRAWLFTIGRRCAIDEQRADRRLLRLALRLFAGRPAESHGRPPSLGLIASEETRRLLDALGGLSETHRTIVLLCLAEGMTSIEVGEVLGMSPQQVRNKLSYARRLLMAELEDRNG
jgi:RNA polymerase sigma factor (sigma-70 family)